MTTIKRYQKSMTAFAVGHTINFKLWLFFCVLAMGLTSFALINAVPSLKVPLFLCAFSLLFVSMLGLRRYWPEGWGYAPIALVAVIARCFLLPLAPSDDVDRYLWEGKCQLHGINPYATPPSDSLTTPFRDAIWQGANHKDFTTIYGPLAQQVFKVAAFAFYSPFALKLVMTMFDLGALVVLLRFLKKRKSRPNEALLYAVNPLVLFSFAGEGHLESLLLFTLAAAILMYQRKHFAWMFMFLGCACCVKCTALMFIPLFVRKETLKYLPFVIIAAVSSLPFGAGIFSLFTTMLRFGTEARFNGCLYALLTPVLSNQTTMFVSASVFLFIYAWNFFLTPNPIKACSAIALGFLLTSPTAHPWYFTIVAMFTVLFPTRSSIALTATVGISWLIIFKYWITGIWKENAFFPLLEYAPSLILGILGHWRLTKYASPGYGMPKSISIIIPVLNEGPRLRVCLDSIRMPEDIQSEIIIVDGGSTDDTLSIAQSDERVKIVISERGRGIQIAEGVNNAVGDLIIVVHADTNLVQNGVERMYRFCSKYPYICGGSVAAKFSAPGLQFSFITALNNFRSRFSGISFGDQVQFFRREALYKVMPRIKLMEDIEISMLLKERGPIAVLPALALSSTRRWQGKSYANNMIMVVVLTFSYLIRRRFGMLKGDNSDYYKAYYETA